MAAILKTNCSCCRNQHLFFLPLGKAAEVTKAYEFTCPRNKVRAKFEPSKLDGWQIADNKPPGSVIVREAFARR